MPGPREPVEMVDLTDPYQATGHRSGTPPDCVYPSAKFPIYACKKTVAGGLLSISLLSSNVKRLRALLLFQCGGPGVSAGERPPGHAPLCAMLITLTSLMVALQMALAVMLLVIGFMDKYWLVPLVVPPGGDGGDAGASGCPQPTKARKERMVNILNDSTIPVAFIILMLNTVVAAFNNE